MIYENTDPKEFTKNNKDFKNQINDMDGSSFTFSKSLSVNSLSTIDTSKLKTPIARNSITTSYATIRKFKANANRLRDKCRRLLRKRRYKVLFIIVLFLSLISTTFETFESSVYHILADTSNLMILISLIMDALVRITAYGLSSGEKSYLGNTKGFFNLICLISSSFDFLGNFGKTGVNRFKSITFFRALQLLRIFLEFEALYVVTIAILKSFKGIFNVLLAVFGVWMLFAIIGMHFFRNRFGYCENPSILNVGKKECELRNQNWVNHISNFDTIGQAFISLLVVSTYDRWSEVLAIAINSDLPDNGPTSKNNAWQSYFYFMSFTIIGSWLFSNLIIGVIFKNFFKEEKKGLHPYLTENQTKWLKLIPIIKKTEPDRYKPPESQWRNFLFRMVTGRKFKNLMFGVICLNVLSLSFKFDRLEFHALYPYYSASRNTFILVYFAESLLKVLSWGAKGYINQKKHWLEIFIVFFLGIHELISYYSTDEILLRYISPFQLFPFLRIMVYFRNLNNLLNTLLFTIPRMFYLVSFMIIFTFIYSVLGWYLFRDIEKIEIMYDDSGFKNIFYSMFILFQIATAEDWAIIMNDCINPKKCKAGIKDCGSKFAIPYFVVYLIFTNFIVINMFVLILLKSFEDFSISNLNPTIFRKSILRIKRAWARVKRTKQKEIEIKNINMIKRDSTKMSNYSKYDFESATLKTLNTNNAKIEKSAFFKSTSKNSKGSLTNNNNVGNMSQSVDRYQKDSIIESEDQEKRHSQPTILSRANKGPESFRDFDNLNNQTSELKESPTINNDNSNKFPEPKSSLLIKLDPSNMELVKEDIPIYATPRKSENAVQNSKKSFQFSEMEFKTESDKERSNSLQIKNNSLSGDSDQVTSTLTKRTKRNSIIKEKLMMSKKLLKSMVTTLGQMVSSKEINDYFIHVDRIPRFLKILGKPLGLKKNANFKEIGSYLATFLVQANNEGFTTFHQVLYATLRNHFKSYLEKNASKKGKVLLEKYNRVFQTNLKHNNSKSVINKVFAKKSEKLKIISPFQIYMQNYTYFQVWKKYVEVVSIYGKFNRIPTDPSSDEEEYNISGGCYNFDVAAVKNNLLQKWFEPIDEEEEEEKM